jgi:L-amino acid N-acyltransferase YncA
MPPVTEGAAGRDGRPARHTDDLRARGARGHGQLRARAAHTRRTRPAARAGPRGRPALARGRGRGGVGEYGYAALYRERPAYRFTVEDSVYVAGWARGQGLGRTLLDAVIAGAAAAGARQIVAVIGDSANSGSIALHRACGFADIGVLRAVGRKFDRWLDTVLMQRKL